MKPIWAIASATVGEAIRRKVLLVILLLGVVVLVIAPGLGILSTRSSATVLRGMTLGIIQMTSAVIAIVLTVHVIPTEIERRTIYTILSKPVKRWQFLLGKYFGAILALALMMTLMCVVLVAVFWIYQTHDPAAIARLLKPPIMYFVQMSLLAALALFFSTWMSPLVNYFLSGGMFLLGSLFQPFFQTMVSNPGTPVIAKSAAWVVNTLLPNFANYNTQNPIVNPNVQIRNESQYYMNAALYGVGYIALLMVLSILVFDKREV